MNLEKDRLEFARSGALPQASASCLALKAPHMIAQGNALGVGPQRFIKP